MSSRVLAVRFPTLPTRHHPPAQTLQGSRLEVSAVEKAGSQPGDVAGEGGFQGTQKGRRAQWGKLLRCWV